MNEDNLNFIPVIIDEVFENESRAIYFSFECELSDPNSGRWLRYFMDDFFSFRRYYQSYPLKFSTILNCLKHNGDFFQNSDDYDELYYNIEDRLGGSISFRSIIIPSKYLPKNIKRSNFIKVDRDLIIDILGDNKNENTYKESFILEEEGVAFNNWIESIMNNIKHIGK